MSITTHLFFSACVLVLAGCSAPSDTPHAKIPFCKTHGGVVALNTGGLQRDFYLVCADGTNQDIIPGQHTAPWPESAEKGQ